MQYLWQQGGRNIVINGTTGKRCPQIRHSGPGLAVLDSLSSRLLVEAEVHV